MDDAMDDATDDATGNATPAAGLETDQSTQGDPVGVAETARCARLAQLDARHAEQSQAARELMDGPDAQQSPHERGFSRRTREAAAYGRRDAPTARTQPRAARITAPWRASPYRTESTVSDKESVALREERHRHV